MLGPLLIAVLLAAGQPTEVLAQVQVHGNTVTSSEEILQLAGLAIGMPLDANALAAIEARLRGARRFEQVEVRKRLASIADPSQVLLVIVVDEGPVRIEYDRERGGVARAVRRRTLPFMFMPVLGVQDGYGFTYGGRFALPDVAGARSRLSFPLTWGGERRAAVEFDKNFTSGPFTRLQAGASLERRVNPFYDRPDGRRRAWVRAERALVPEVRVGATAGWERVGFMDAASRFGRIGVDAVVDTRLDPFLSRNAVFGRAAWQRLDFGRAMTRTELEARGYLGLIGQSVLVARVLREDASAPLPPYLKSLAGGLDTLRGFRAGSAAGDTLVASSLELRVPLNSPMNIAKVGVSAFADVAAAYDKGQRAEDQQFRRGVGGAVWLTAAMLRVNLAVAHGTGGSTRAHFSTSLVF